MKQNNPINVQKTTIGTISGKNAIHHKNMRNGYLAGAFAE